MVPRLGPAEQHQAAQACRAPSAPSRGTPQHLPSCELEGTATQPPRPPHPRFPPSPHSARLRGKSPRSPGSGAGASLPRSQRQQCRSPAPGGAAGAAARLPLPLPLPGTSRCRGQGRGQGDRELPPGGNGEWEKTPTSIDRMLSYDMLSNRLRS